jgi:hypothetical protein
LNAKLFEGSPPDGLALDRVAFLRACRSLLARQDEQTPSFGTVIGLPRGNPGLSEGDEARPFLFGWERIER